MSPAYEQGWKAYEGEPDDDFIGNPYLPDTAEYKDWEEGFDRARKLHRNWSGYE